jgi:hypothetical protein
MRGRDWQSERLRYVGHFSDGGAGTRYVDERLKAGSELRDGGLRYVIERVEQPSTPFVLGHAWARLLDEASRSLFGGGPGRPRSSPGRLSRCP